MQQFKFDTHNVGDALTQIDRTVRGTGRPMIFRVTGHHDNIDKHLPLFKTAGISVSFVSYSTWTGRVDGEIHVGGTPEALNHILLDVTSK